MLELLPETMVSRQDVTGGAMTYPVEAWFENYTEVEDKIVSLLVEERSGAGWSITDEGKKFSSVKIWQSKRKMLVDKKADNMLVWVMPRVLADPVQVAIL